MATDRAACRSARLLTRSSSPPARRRRPISLKQQLAEGGRLVIPISVNAHQDLKVITRRGDAFEEKNLGAVRFVPLMGEEGWLERN